MAVLLLLVLLTPDITSVGQGFSQSIADCNIVQHGHSLYKQYCCISSNKGKIICLTENGRKKIILCPSTRPSSCPRKISIYCLYLLLYLHLSALVILTDCKKWFESGNTTSGIYIINPDGQTPFEVINDICIVSYTVLY